MTTEQHVEYHALLEDIECYDYQGECTTTFNEMYHPDELDLPSSDYKELNFNYGELIWDTK